MVLFKFISIILDNLCLNFNVSESIKRVLACYIPTFLFFFSCALFTQYLHIIGEEDDKIHISWIIPTFFFVIVILMIGIPTITFIKSILNQNNIDWRNLYQNTYFKKNDDRKNQDLVILSNKFDTNINSTITLNTNADLLSPNINSEDEKLLNQSIISHNVVDAEQIV